MKGLLLKDLYLMKELKKFLIIIALISVVMLMGKNQESFVAGYVSVMSVIVVLNSVSYDDYNKGFSFLMTMPVSRKDYVAEKYCFGVLVELAGWAIGVMMVIGKQLLTGTVGGWTELLASWGAMLGISFLSMAVMLPFALKYGSEKGRMAMMAVFFAFFCVIMLAANLFKGMKSQILQMAVNFLDSNAAALVFLLAAAAGLWVSYLLSCRIMEKKEF